MLLQFIAKQIVTFRLALSLMIVCSLASCTSGLNNTAEVNGFVINQADKIYISMVEANKIGLGDDYEINLKTLHADFTAPAVLLPLTDVVKTVIDSPVPIKIVLPKTVQSVRPMLVTIDLPLLNTQLTDVLFAGEDHAEPGMVSTLAYDLIKYYTGKNLNQYTAAEFKAIKALIQTRVTQMLSESEHLSLSSTRYDRLVRYFKNGLAFNVEFLTAIRAQGVNYSFTPVLPAGLTCALVPEFDSSNPTDPHCLDAYYYAGSFMVGGSAAKYNPFNQSNEPAKILPGSANPSVGNNIFVLEGKKIEVRAQAFDVNDDFLDKNFIVKYTPRVLPAIIDQNHLIKPEHSAEYTSLNDLSAPDGVDTYTSDTIQFDEALDNTEAGYSTGKTAERNVYYMITDGSVRIPVFWGFKYSDMRRPPVFVTDSNGGINQTDQDAALATEFGETNNTWKTHISHCETDQTDSVQTIKNKQDGPWFCVFKVFDPDLDDDPNAAADQFAYSLTQTDAFTEISINDYPAWPPAPPTYTVNNPYLVPASATPAPPSSYATTVPTCTTADGKTHLKCGVVRYKVTVDNGVKASAETKSDLTYTFTPEVFDRPVSGLSTSHPVTRRIEFAPIPARLVNFSNQNAPGGAAALNAVDPLNPDVYLRQDIYLNELLPFADPNSSLAYSVLGFNTASFGTANRSTNFFAGTAVAMSDYVTQPRNITANNATTGAAGTINYLGHTLTTFDQSTYKAPREFDSTCSLDENNFNVSENWDQRAPSAILVGPDASAVKNTKQSGGWIFEINAIDLDNVNLRVGEPNDPVFTKFGSPATDISSSINKTGIQYCWFKQPNLDPVNFQTYGAVGTTPAVDADYCDWQSNPPLQMQPVPVFYQLSGKVRKLVYHRLRIKWQPKDQASLGKTYTDPAGYIQNTLNSFQMAGNVYLQDNSKTFDQNVLKTGLKLMALHKDMKPCTKGIANNVQYVHQLNQTPKALGFYVEDENKTLGYNSFFTGALMGRYEAELTLKGTRTISNAEVAKFVPFIENCTIQDQSDPSGPTPTPPPTVSTVEPAIWYAKADNIPRIRLKSVTNPALPTALSTLPFCLRYSYSSLTNSAGTQVYQTVVKVDNYSATPFTLDASNTSGGGSPGTVPFNTTCFSRSSLAIDPDQKTILLASRCAATAGDVLWDTATSKATVLQNQAPANYGLSFIPTGTPLNFKLFPAFYQSNSTTSNLDLMNGLFFDIAAIDTFKLNSGAQNIPSYAGYGTWVPTNAANVGPAPLLPVVAPGLPTLPGDHSMQVVDWDNQPNYIFPGAVTISTPVPSPTASPNPTPAALVRMAPSSSNTIQVFLKYFPKNSASVSFNVKSSDVADGILDTDIFDVRTFNFAAMPSPSPANLPLFTGNGRANCNTLPATYPALANLISLVGSGLATYRTCDFSWTPTLADNGKKYTIGFKVQDNPGAVPSPSPNVFGIGARHPAANTLSGIPQDSLDLANGLGVDFNIQLESLEENVAPLITGSSYDYLHPNTNSYVNAGGGSGWTTVFSGTAGVQPFPSPGVCSTATISTAYSSASFDCSLRVSDGDILQSTTPTAMIEGVQSPFTVYAADSNKTANLKTISLSAAPTKVLIVDGTYAGKTFTVPSFLSGFTVTSTVVAANGTASFSFGWKPTDLEANILSNPGGFLIPIDIKDQQYVPASDSGFNPAFIVGSMPTRVWLWAKISVVNSIPQVVVVNSNGTDGPALAGGTVTFQTGQTASCSGAMSTWVNCFKIRIKDTDISRYIISNDTTAHGWTYTSPVAPTGTPFSTASSVSTLLPGPSPYQFLSEELIISASPKTSDLGSYVTASIVVTDPGDISRGTVAIPNAINPDTSGSPIRAKVSALGNTQTVSFNTLVVGTALFLAPKAASLLPGPTSTPSQVNAYTQRPFSYPTSMLVSRPSEMGKPFFVGINKNTTLTPVRKAATGSTSTGIYVNEKLVVKWPDPAIADLNFSAPDRTLPLYAVQGAPTDTICKSSTPTITLMRFNETTQTMEYCAISGANYTANASLASMVITLVSAAPATAPSITSTEALRIFNPSPTPASVTTALGLQYADFKGRCQFCDTASSSNASPSGLVLNESLGSDGYVQFSFSSYVNRFEFNNSALSDPTKNLVQKRYQDTAPTTARSINLFAAKNEKVTLAANLNPATMPSAAPYPVYHWYVNGCLKDSGVITSTASVSYNLTISSLMSGLNNDCAGEYSSTETNAGALGKLIVRLTIGNGTETLNSTSDGMTTTYVWNVNVLNTDPSLKTDSTILSSAPISLSTQYAGASSSSFALPINHAGKEYLAYTDVGTSLSVRFREIDISGNLVGSALASGLNLNCGSFLGAPNMLGIQPDISGKIYVSVSTVAKPYPIGASANSFYGSSNSSCFTNLLSPAAPTQAPVAFGANSTVPAGYLPFSKYTRYTTPIASFTNASSPYLNNSNDANYFMLETSNASSYFWSSAFTSMYSSTPAELAAPYSNVVRKNIVDGTTLFSLLGASSNSANGWKGFILIRDLAASNKSVIASGTNKIMFASGASAPDCGFDGTPLDATYVSASDTLFVLANANDGSGYGHLVAITGAKTNSPSCKIVDTNALNRVMNPSLTISEYNTNIPKLYYDSTRAMLYGVSIQAGGTASQYFVYDTLSDVLVNRSISSSIYPYSIVHSPSLNALYIYDGRRSGGLFPTLYRIW